MNDRPAPVRYRIIPFALLLVTLLLSAGGLRADDRKPSDSNPQKTAAILDTDIGDDIDDTWALGLLLKSPELDLKLVVGDFGKATYRARLLAKFLTVANRTDVAVGVGLNPDDPKGNQSKWIDGYDLKSYPGKVYRDGVQAIIDTILASPKPVTLICIGPCPNIAEALRREPKITQHARLVGMFGSLRIGYDGKPPPAAEWNVKADAKSAHAALTAPWSGGITITPLDTCGLVHLDGARYRRVRDSKDPIAAVVIENYRIWSAAQNNAKQAESASSTLFDTVAVYLAVSHDLVKIEHLKLDVTDDGKTVIDDQHGTPMDVATRWKDMGADEDFLVNRLTGTAAVAR